jgi:signal transduction histidine kinase
MKAVQVERLKVRRPALGDLLSRTPTLAATSATSTHWPLPLLWLHVLDLDDVDLMVCEIVTNAVRHTASGDSGGGGWVSVLVVAGRLRVEIQDDGHSRGRPLILYKVPVGASPGAASWW